MSVLVERIYYSVCFFENVCKLLRLWIKKPVINILESVFNLTNEKRSPSYVYITNN